VERFLLRQDIARYLERLTAEPDRDAQMMLVELMARDMGRLKEIQGTPVLGQADRRSADNLYSVFTG